MCKANHLLYKAIKMFEMSALITLEAYRNLNYTKNYCDIV